MTTLDHFTTWLLLAEPAAAGADGGGGGIWQILMSPMFPFVAIFVLFMLLILPSERKRKAQQSKLLDGLKKNDRVVTVGGLLGTVVNVQKGDEYVVLRIDENSNARATVLRSAIARVLGDNDASKKEKASD